MLIPSGAPHPFRAPAGCPSAPARATPTGDRCREASSRSADARASSRSATPAQAASLAPGRGGAASAPTRSCRPPRTVLFDGVDDRDGVAALLGGWAPGRRRGTGDAGRDPGDLRRPGPRRRRATAGASTVDEVVGRAHRASSSSSPSAGSRPGFAYLTGLPEELAVPRLDTPRRAGAGRARSALAGHVVRRLPDGVARAAGGCSAAPTRVLWDADRDPPGAAAAGHPGEVRGPMSAVDASLDAGAAHHRPGPRPARARPPRRPPGRCAGRAGRRAGQPAGRQRRADAALLEIDARRVVAAARRRRRWVAVTGAPVRRSTSTAAPVAPRASRSACRPGAVLAVGAPADRACAPTSRSPAASTSTPVLGLAVHRHPRLGRAAPASRDGDRLPVGPRRPGRPRPPRHAPAAAAPGRCGCAPGPRADWFAGDALERAVRGRRTPSRRTRTGSGCGSTGPPLERARDGRAAQRGDGARARCRCRPTGSRWCSSPTTRRPAATRWSAVVARRRPVAVRPAAAGGAGAVHSA